MMIASHRGYRSVLRKCVFLQSGPDCMYSKRDVTAPTLTSGMVPAMVRRLKQQYPSAAIYSQCVTPFPGIQKTSAITFAEVRTEPDYELGRL